MTTVAEIRTSIAETETNLKNAVESQNETLIPIYKDLLISHQSHLNLLLTAQPFKYDNFSFDEFEDTVLNHLRDRYEVDLDIMRQPLELADFGGLTDQKVKTFGQTLFGTDDIQRKLAMDDELRFKSFRAAQASNFKTHQVKENYKVPVLLSGLGTGKSSMLDHHKEALRTNCEDPELKALLERSASPLVLSATFNSVSPFTAKEIESENESDNLPERMVALRLLCTHFAIDWQDVRGSLLPSRSGVLKDTVKLIARHHKRTHGLPESARIAIFINLDEINQISMVLDAKEGAADAKMVTKKRADAKTVTAVAAPAPPRSLDQELTKSEQIVREITTVLRALSMRGIDDCSPVFPFLAGTAHQHFMNSLRNSGVECLSESMPTLTPEQVLEALRRSNVPEAYLQNREFLRLLDQSGGVPRVIRKIIEPLTMQFDASLIGEGRKQAIKYLSGKIKMSSSDVAGLLPAVLLGEPHSLADNLPNSTLTYEQLQKSGVVWMVPLEGKLQLFHVTMPLLSLRALCKGYTHPDTRYASKLLDNLDETDWRKFEILTARFSAFKMDWLARTGDTSVSMGDFYGDVDMAPDVAELEVELRADKKYEVMQPYVTQRYPIDRVVASAMTWAAGRARLTAANTLRGLNNGKVLVNAHGSAIDCVMLDPLTSGGQLVRALCVAHTVAGATLELSKINADRTKALNAVANSADLSSAARCITVHITNRELQRRVKACNPDSVVVSHRNLAAFFGPVLSRGLWSDTYWAKHSSSWTSKGGGARQQFSTMCHRPGTARLLTTQSDSLRGKLAAGKVRGPAVAATVRWTAGLVMKIFAK